MFTGINESFELETQKLADQLAPVLKRHGIVRASIFGSMARGEITPESDLDLLVEYMSGKTQTFLGFLSLQEELETLVGRKVEIIRRDLLHPILKDQVRNDEFPIL
jgi:predicted nucleotidyltransferase